MVSFLTVPQCYLSLTMTSYPFQVMKLPSNGQVNGMMNGNAKKRFGVNKSAGILKPSTSCPNLTASDLNRNGYRNHRSSIDISSSGYPKPVLHFLLTSRLTFCVNIHNVKIGQAAPRFLSSHLVGRRQPNVNIVDVNT